MRRLVAFLVLALLAGSAQAQAWRDSSTGSTRVITLGTVTTGTWNATVVAPAYGGTGVANNAAATLIRSGNHALTVTTTATTGVTLPTTGTLSTLAGSETLTNKVLTSPALTVQALAVTATPTWNMALGIMGTVALSGGNVAPVVTNPPTGGSVAFKITQDSTPRTITWPAGDGTSTLKVMWALGTAPTLSSGSGAVDMVTCNVFTQFIWYCVWIGTFS